MKSKNKSSKNNFYCGNNALSPKIIKQGYKIGSPYTCLRKGIGVGLNLPLDKNAAGPYKPIKKNDYFCGKDKTKIPKEYKRLGSSVECLQTGIGIGRKIKAKKAKKSLNKKKRNKRKRRWYKKRMNIGQSTKIKVNVFIKYILPILIIVISTIILSLSLYYTKPKFLLNKRKKIDKDKYLILIYLFLLFVSTITIIIWKYYFL